MLLPSILFVNNIFIYAGGRKFRHISVVYDFKPLQMNVYSYNAAMTALPGIP